MSIPDALQRFKECVEPLLIKLEEERKTTVIPILYSMNRFIANADVDEIYNCLANIGEQPKIDVILFSGGGDPDQAYLISTMLQRYAKEKLSVIVPRYAKSAASLIACAADEIIMLPPSELGPVDLVIRIPDTKRSIPVLSLLELVDMIGRMPKPIIPSFTTISDVIDKMLSKVPIVELGDYSRLMEHMTRLTEKLLSKRMMKDDPKKAQSVAKALCEGYKSHSAAISQVDATELGLRLSEISKDIQDVIWSIHKLWLDIVIEYENEFSEEASIKAMNLNVGKGIVFSSIIINTV